VIGYFNAGTYIIGFCNIYFIFVILNTLEIPFNYYGLINYIGCHKK